MKKYVFSLIELRIENFIAPETDTGFLFSFGFYFTPALRMNNNV